MDAPQWLEFDGTVNVRDVGGLPTADGRQVRSGALIRSASLQHLTDEDVRRLVHDYGVRRVVDLRTDVEVDQLGHGPLREAPEVTVHHLSLYPDSGSTLAHAPEIPAANRADTAADPDDDGAAADGGLDENVIAPSLPWYGEGMNNRSRVVAGYLRYLQRRPDSVVAALRAIAEPDGATVVHCAAGKDRTGMIVAFALTVAGVDRDAIAADYGATESQLGAILDLLSRSGLYDREVKNPTSIPLPTADTMREALAAVDEEFGGVLTWLSGHGWTQQDTEMLTSKLIGA
jgi:protein tyrosine/serine phosphatase